MTARLPPGSSLGCALVHDAWPTARLLPGAIRSQSAPSTLVATAYPVAHHRDDNLALHCAVQRAAAGSVVVSATGGAGTAGLWGAVLSAAALERGVLGLITDGCVRDADEVATMGFRVYAAGRDPRKATKQDPGVLGDAVRIGGVEVASGDLVVADGDGIAVVAAAEMSDAIDAALALAQREVELCERIRAGASTLELLGLGAGSSSGPGREEER